MPGHKQRPRCTVVGFFQHHIIHLHVAVLPRIRLFEPKWRLVRHDSNSASVYCHSNTAGKCNLPKCGAGWIVCACLILGGCFDSPTHDHGLQCAPALRVIRSTVGNFTAVDAAHAKLPFPGYPILLSTLTVFHTGDAAQPTGLTTVDVEILSVSVAGQSAERNRRSHRHSRSDDHAHNTMHRHSHSGNSGHQLPLVTLHARLFGNSMGIFVTEIGHPDGPVFWTVRQYNAWKYFRLMPNATSPPRRLPVVTRFIGASDDADEWREGIGAVPARATAPPLGTLGPSYRGGVNITRQSLWCEAALPYSCDHDANSRPCGRVRQVR